MEEFDFDGTLDLTGADGSVPTFDPIPSGKYQAKVKKAEWKATSNPDGSKALPDGTPYLNVQIQVNEDEEPRNGDKVANKVVFWKGFSPPKGYDTEKSMKMKNSFVNFLTSVGYTMEEIQSKKFRIDPDDLGGRDCTVIVQRKMNNFTNEMDNNVQGFKPAGDSSPVSRSGALI